jgi:glucosylceramidase
MRNTTRRSFLQLATATAASFAARDSLCTNEKRPTREIRAWTTSGKIKFAPSAPPRWVKSEKTVTRTIDIDITDRRQKILGFGAAFTDASCYLLNQLAHERRVAVLSDLFGTSGLRLSVGRTCIGASDYSTSLYSLDDSVAPDPALKAFSIRHDQAYILPILQAVRAMNPDLFLLSSPWSPPGWMKVGNSMLGGSIKKKYFPSYAEYFVRFLQEYSALGVKINAVTVQNEVDTDQDGRMPAALWGQEYEIEFIKNYLGPALQHAAPDVKIWLLDHNYNLWGRVLDELCDPEVFRFVDGVAWHSYGGGPESMTRVHEAFPEKHTYWTEGGPDITSPDYSTDWVKWSTVFTGILRNWARCIIGWNLVLDEKGMPNIGPFPCGGLVTLDSRTNQVVHSGQYVAFAHYSKVVQRGALVIGSHGNFQDIDHVAFENPDGTRVLVITNQGAPQELNCRIEKSSMALSLEGASITTILW